MNFKSLKLLFLFNSLSLVLGLSTSEVSFAEETLTVANLHQTADNLPAPLPNDAQADAVSDTLSESAKASLEQIDEESDVEANQTTEIKATTANNIASSSEKEVVITVQKPINLNSGSQLSHLTFKGTGGGIARYKEAAAQYCRDARDHNDANAEFALGWLYINGKGVEKDEHIAALFFNKAAEQGHASAKNWLETSKGDPKLATLPSCMLPDSVPTMVSANTSADEQLTENPPFYAKGPIYKMVSKIAPNYKIETDFAMAFIAVESGFNPKAKSPKNAQGLMQLIPETAARFNVKDAYDPEQNIKGGLAYLQWLLAYFKGDVSLVAAAYNAGENTVEKYKGVPPYPETKKYVKKIASLYRKSMHPYREDLGLSKSFKTSKVSG